MDIWIQVSFLLILLKLLLMDNVMVKLQIKVKIESSLCSLRCPPPTGPGTRRSLWLWLRSRRPAARTIPSTGEELIGFDMLSLIIEDVISFDVLCLWFDIFKICRRCSSSSRTCVRKDLFCDGRINCALKTSKPPDETSCRWGSSSWSRWWRAIALCRQKNMQPSLSVFLTMPISVQDLSFMPLKWIKLIFPAWQRVHLNQNLRCGKTRACLTSPASSLASSSSLFSSPMSPRTFNRRRRRPAQSVSLTGGYKNPFIGGSFTVSRPKCYFISIQAKIGYILGVVLKSPKVFRFPTVQQIIDYSISLSLADVMRDPWM